MQAQVLPPVQANGVYTVNKQEVRCVALTEWATGPLRGTRVFTLQSTADAQVEYQGTQYADGTVFRIRASNPA